MHVLSSPILSSPLLSSSLLYSNLLSSSAFISHSLLSFPLYSSRHPCHSFILIFPLSFILNITASYSRQTYSLGQQGEQSLSSILSFSISQDSSLVPIEFLSWWCHDSWKENFPNEVRKEVHYYSITIALFLLCYVFFISLYFLCILWSFINCYSAFSLVALSTTLLYFTLLYSTLLCLRMATQDQRWSKIDFKFQDYITVQSVYASHLPLPL